MPVTKEFRLWSELFSFTLLFRHHRKFTLTTDWHGYWWFSLKILLKYCFCYSPNLWSQILFLRIGATQALLSWNVLCPAPIPLLPRLWQFHKVGLFPGCWIFLASEARATLPPSAGLSLPQPLRLILSLGKRNTSSLIQHQVSVSAISVLIQRVCKSVTCVISVILLKNPIK